MAILFFNAVMIVIAFLARKESFLVKYSTSLLLLFAALGILRIFLPLDLQAAYVIPSYTVYPAVQDAMRMNVSFFSDSIPLGRLLLYVWFTGTAVTTLLKARQLRRERKCLRSFCCVNSPVVDRAAAQLDLKNVKLVVSPQVAVPMSTGFPKAYIYLPNIDLSEEEWKFILTHEYQHIRSHDTLIRLFYLLLLALFWWNPVVYWFQKTLDQLLELRCDANVTKDMDAAQKELYLTSILDVVRELRGRRSSQVPVMSSPLIYGQARSSAVQRFDVVLNGRQASRKVHAAVAALAICMFLTSYLVILQPAGYPSPEELAGGVRVSPQNAYIFVKEDGTKQLYVNNKVLFGDIDEKTIQQDFKDIPTIYEGESN